MPEEIFTEAPEEVTRYFRAKQSKPSFDWRDVAPQEHAVSFTIAKSAGFDILDDVRAELDKAIADFKPFGDFVEELEPTLRKKGWWGRQLVDDPTTGKPTIARLGSLSRLRTIYWANVSTARASGEWERIQRTKRGLPFLIYELSVAERRRPEHMGWVGVILPVDDPFWQTHYPPNGWLCQCRVRQISRFEAEELGYDPETGGPQVVTKPWTNKRTGERFDVPEGIDPGWQTNPGITRAQNVRAFLRDRLEVIPDAFKNAAVADLVGSNQFRSLVEGRLKFNGRADRSPENVASGRIAIPVGMLSSKLERLLETRVRTVMLSNEDAHKQLAKRRSKGGAELTVKPEDYAKVQTLIETGTGYEDTKGLSSYLVQGLVDGKPWVAVLKVTGRRDEIFLKSLHRIEETDLAPKDRLIPLE